jgi:secreted trypsin-like serine protease
MGTFLILMNTGRALQIIMIFAFLLLLIAVATAQECGKPEVQGIRVIAGKTAVRGSWPWQVLMKFGGRAGCGGTLIAPQWVVTAAHCVYRREMYPWMFSVVVGEHDRERN